MASVLYSDDKDYSQILKDTHNRMIAKMKRNTDKKNALELQTILQEIKMVAKDFSNINKSVIGNAMYEEYYDLINTAFLLQKPAHGSNFSPDTLFRRAHGAKTIAAADDIFEEDLAAILAAGESLGTGSKDINLEMFLFGTQSTGTKATKAYDPNALIADIDDNAQTLIRKLAEKENKKASTEIRNATGKIDVSGQRISLEYTKPISFKVERLMMLMKDATVSAKNYSTKSWSLTDKKDLADMRLHLGNTNIYKAVTGALSEVQMGHKQQQSFFYRGMNTMLHNSHGYGEFTKEHFNHLRFIYELRGSGLLNEQGLILPVKYMIYNDPSSDAIFVRDTASIILEALDKATIGNNLFGGISIGAMDTQS